MRTYATAERIRARLVDDLPEIIEGTIAAAKAGDPQARRLVFEYSLSKPKPSEAPVLMEPLTGTLPQQAQQLLDAMAQGRISPDQCSKLLVGLGAVAHAAEVDAITARMKAIEQALEHRSGQT